MNVALIDSGAKPEPRLERESGVDWWSAALFAAVALMVLAVVLVGARRRAHTPARRSAATVGVLVLAVAVVALGLPL